MCEKVRFGVKGVKFFFLGYQEETLQFYVPVAKQLGLTQAVEELQSLVFEVFNRGGAGV